MFDLAIIGGGFSGMIATIQAAKLGLSVVIIESGDRLGKKLLATGNGRCNLTNMVMSTDFYNTDKIANILKNYPPEKMRADLLEIGLVTKVRSDRVYPFSDQSCNVLDLLIDNLEDCGASVRLGATVNKITKAADEKSFTLATSDGNISAVKVCLASGSTASFGRNSMSLLSDINHQCTDLKCGLSAFEAVHIADIKGLAGARQEGLVSLIVDDKVVCQEFGEIQFRRDSLSGIVMFNMQSRLQWLGHYRGTVSIDFMPDFTAEQVSKFTDNCTTFDFGMLHRNLMGNIAGKGVKSIKAFTVDVRVCDDLERAQVATGGLDLDMFDLSTMQSKLCDNIFAIGEVLDVDGLCGGYNLHWAYASASTFTSGLKEKL